MRRAYPGHQGGEGAKVAVPAAILERNEKALRLLRRAGEHPNLARCLGDRLVADHVLPGSERLPRLLDVHEVGGGDHHQLDRAVLQQLVQRRKTSDRQETESASISREVTTAASFELRQGLDERRVQGIARQVQSQRFRL